MDKDIAAQRDSVVIEGDKARWSNTWIAGGFYAGFWNEDKVRYQGLALYADAKLKYYGNSGPLPGVRNVDFNI